MRARWWFIFLAIGVPLGCSHCKKSNPQDVDAGASTTASSTVGSSNDGGLSSGDAGQLAQLGQSNTTFSYPIADGSELRYDSRLSPIDEPTRRALGKHGAREIAEALLPPLDTDDDESLPDDLVDNEQLDAGPAQSDAGSPQADSDSGPDNDLDDADVTQIEEIQAVRMDLLRLDADAAKVVPNALVVLMQTTRRPSEGVETRSTYVAIFADEGATLHELASLPDEITDEEDLDEENDNEVSLDSWRIREDGVALALTHKQDRRNEESGHGSSNLCLYILHGEELLMVANFDLGSWTAHSVSSEDGDSTRSEISEVDVELSDKKTNGFFDLIGTGSSRVELDGQEQSRQKGNQTTSHWNGTGYVSK
jgi:hypothetical protein